MTLSAETVRTTDNYVNQELPTNGMGEDKLKIAFGYDGSLAYNSGVSNYILTLGDYLANRGHDVHYFVAHSQIDKPNTHVLANTIEVSTNGSICHEALPARSRSVKEKFEEVQPDVFHSQLPFHPFVTGHGIKNLGPETAKIGTFHTLAETPAARALSWVIARGIRGEVAQFDETFCSTQPLQRQIKGNYGMDTTLLPLPVDVAKLSSGTRMAEFDDGKLNLAFLGRLDPRKGCQHLLGALSLLDTDTKNQVRLLVAGDGQLRTELESTVAENGLSNTVTFLGDISPEDKPDFLATSDIAVFPATKGESFGLVLAEALAGTRGIVVGGNNPGYSSALAHQREALFDPTATLDTATFIKNLIRNDKLRDSIRIRQQTLVDTYDIKTIGPVIESTYLQAVRERSSV